MDISPSHPARARTSETGSGAELVQASADDVARIWTFLCESGFLYADKVRTLDVPQVQATLAQLLEGGDELFRTLLLCDEGAILAHVSAVRTYQRTWLCQHLAARAQTPRLSALGRRLSVVQLEQLARTESAEWIELCHRPDNAWAQRLFGDFARGERDPETARVRTWCYLIDESPDMAPSPTRRARRALESDRATFEACLHEAEDGLYLRAHDLVAGADSDSGQEPSSGQAELGALSHIGELYQRKGLVRRRETWIDERGRGVALWEQTSAGVNFSELTNAVALYGAEDDPDALQALVAEVRTRLRPARVPPAVVLCSERQAPHLVAAGYRLARRYARVTLHISRIAEFVRYLQKPSRRAGGL